MDDTHAMVQQAYQGHPTYSCSKCSAVIVGRLPTGIVCGEILMRALVSPSRTNSSAKHSPVETVADSKYPALFLRDNISYRTLSVRHAQSHPVRHERQAGAKRRQVTHVRPVHQRCRHIMALNPFISVIMNNRTGVHTVADVFCVGCNDRLGWFYHKAADHGQKYKEGEDYVFILSLLVL